MGLKWLDKEKKKNWLDITREERLFCAHLYFDIKDQEKLFVEWLNSKLEGLQCNPGAEWEVGYEVCFYRDYLYSKSHKIREYNRDKEKQYSEKRTFDLCLFSDEQIIIIEAKVQQGFNAHQIKSFVEDKTAVQGILKDTNENIRVDIVGLCSSTYLSNLEKHGKCAILDPFDGHIITWKEISEIEKFRYNNKDIYIKANDEIYGK